MRFFFCTYILFYQLRTKCRAFYWNNLIEIDSYLKFIEEKFKYVHLPQMLFCVKIEIPTNLHWYSSPFSFYIFTAEKEIISSCWSTEAQTYTAKFFVFGFIYYFRFQCLEFYSTRLISVSLGIFSIPMLSSLNLYIEFYATDHYLQFCILCFLVALRRLRNH